jgi:hypothetical protein
VLISVLVSVDKVGRGSHLFVLRLVVEVFFGVRVVPAFRLVDFFGADLVPVFADFLTAFMVVFFTAFPGCFLVDSGADFACFAAVFLADLRAGFTDC